MSEALTECGWATRVENSRIVVALSGDWLLRRTSVLTGAAEEILGSSEASTLAFDTRGLGRWDSGLIVFLRDLCAWAGTHGVGFDAAGLPQPARRLLALVSSDVVSAPTPPAHRGLTERVGRWAIALCSEIVSVLSSVGQFVLCVIPVLRGRSGMRRGDVMECVWDAGLAALPIVCVVNVLVGGILAFVGGVQMRRFGAGIYVANLVGVAVVREMAALMTAIIMSGRTGGAYAAHIATMQGNEEIDALRVVGIPVFDYLVLPRVGALTCMMPILYLYGCAVGIAGGFLVAVFLFDVDSESFITQVRSAVDGYQFMLGLAKSVVFGAVIAFVGCKVGLRAGRSAADVGRAATTAVVVGIVSVIVLDAVFAVCANVLDI